MIPDYTKVEIFAGDVARELAEEYAARNNGRVFEADEFNKLYPEYRLEAWPRIFGITVKYVVVIK